MTSALIMFIRGFALSFLILWGQTFAKDSIPRFLVEPQSAIVRTGSLVVLYCSVEPSTASVRWMINGTFITSQKRRGFDLRDGSNLRILSFNQPDSLSHDGTYQCVATNSLGTVVSKEAKVEAAVLGSYSASRTLTNITVIEGNVAVFPCSLPDSKPRSVVEFLFNGSKLSPSARHVHLPSGNLQIARVSAGDQGLYQCSAVNQVTGTSVASPATFRLQVVAAKSSEVPAAFTSAPSELITVSQGSNLTLECAAEGWPVPHITWEKYGGHLPIGRFSQMLGNLVISRIQKFDAGTYLCRVNKSSGGQTLDKVINVDVLEPPSIETMPADQTATEGSTVVFKCRPQGSPKQGLPKPSVQWLFNGEAIINEQFIAVRDTTLTLSNIHRRRSGIYQCIVRNALGMVHAAARLSVIDPQAQAKTTPSVPPTPGGRATMENEYDDYEEEDEEDEEEYDLYDDLDLNDRSKQRNREGVDEKGGWNPGTRLPGEDNGGRSGPSKPKVTILTNSSVELQWHMPATHPGEPSVAMFKIQIKEIIDESSSRWLSLDDDVSYGLRMFEVRGLRPGRTYRFRVVVLFSDNNRKPGPVSAKVTLTLTGAAGRTVVIPAPVIVEAHSISRNKIYISWQQSEADQWPPEGFCIYYEPYNRNANSKKLKLHGTSTRNYVLSDLIPGTAYRIRLRSFGKSGEKSGFSNAVVKNTFKEDEEIVPQNFPGLRSQSTRKMDKDTSTGTPEGQREPLGDPHEGRSSDNQLTYIVVGILLGVVVIIIVSCAFLCFWKQQKKQRYNDGERKHADQTTAFLSNKRPSKPDALNGLVNISDYTYKVDNGHLPGCSGECSLGGTYGCKDKDMRNTGCSARPSGQSRKLVPDLVLPPPPAMPPPSHPCHSQHPEISIYDTVDDDHGKVSPAYAKLSSLDSESAGGYPSFPNQEVFGNLPRPTSDNIPPKPLDSHAYWVLEHSRNQSLPERTNNHVGAFAPSHPGSHRQSLSASQPCNKSIKTAYDRDGMTLQSTDDEPDHYDKPASPQDILNHLPSAPAYCDDNQMNIREPFSWPLVGGKPSNPDPVFPQEPLIGGRRVGQNPPDSVLSYPNTKDMSHDSWKSLASKVSNGQYSIHSGPGKTSQLTTPFGLPRANDYPSSDQEDCR